MVPDVWDRIITKFGIRSVLDVGCGGGYALEWFAKHGVRAVGVEGFQEAIERSPVPHLIVRHDYTKGPYAPRRRFDLCWCAEFVEHVEQRFIANFVASFRCCRFVAMTHAVPGQGGFHHVNEQPPAYWEDIMTKHGFELDRKETTRLRKFRPGVPYGVNNLLFFVKSKASNATPFPKSNSRRKSNDARHQS